MPQRFQWGLAGWLSSLVLLCIGVFGATIAHAAPPDRIVVYCSVDESFARPILTAFQEEHGIAVAPVFDGEAGKTTGLVQRIMQEASAGRPRADLFWSSEIFNTIRLARRGLLEPFDPPSAADIPSRFRDPEHRWTGVSVRARVLAYDRAKFSSEHLPTTWEQLAAPPYVSQLAIANPLFGTTRGHVSAMFALWGKDRARAYLTRLRDGGAFIADGNSAAVRAVMDGRFALAATDTDDVWLAQKRGSAIGLRYLDLGDGGTLLVPCTVALVRGGPNLDAAKKLLDVLASEKVERLLAVSDSRNIPVRSGLREELHLSWPPESSVSFDAVANAMDEAEAAVREILLR
ncbi:MAG: extracellular solute-binding protein [Planctomycetota bacterium]